MLAHLRPEHHGRSLPRHRERGALTVELAMVCLFLMTMVAGTYDYGMAWRGALVVNEAARSAARTGSALGTNVQADWYALSAARAALTNGGRINDVTKVIVYRSDTVDGAVPADCLNNVTTTTAACTVITGSQLRGMTASAFSATTGCFTAATIKNWCSTTRNSVQLTAEYYGIYIQVQMPFTFRTITTSTTISRYAVMRLEPGAS